MSNKEIIDLVKKSNYIKNILKNNNGLILKNSSITKNCIRMTFKNTFISLGKFTHQNMAHDLNFYIDLTLRDIKIYDKYGIQFYKFLRFFIDKYNYNIYNLSLVFGDNHFSFYDDYLDIHIENYLFKFRNDIFNFGYIFKIILNLIKYGNWESFKVIINF